LVEGAVAAGDPVDAVFTRVADAVGVRGPLVTAGSTEGRPRLTEPWFC
jgi:hypothetical protein